LSNLISHFLLVLTFFTRLRLPESLGNHIDHDSRLTDAVVFFPLVGFGIGLITGGVWYLSSMFLPAGVSAGLAISVGLVLTGALHEDGFADCADGLGGSTDRAKTLEIMHDSRIGTYGGLALVVSVGLRWACIMALSPFSGVCALVISHTASRSSMPLAMKWSQYARTQGLGKLASGEVPDAQFFISILVAFVCSVLFGGIAGLIAVSIALISSWCFLKYLEARLGGYTGDGLGAMQQIAEITALIILAGAWA